MITIPKHIKELEPYKAGKPIEELAREKGITKIVKLASNENPLGPSPRAIEAVKKHTGQLHRYTNPLAYKLVKKLAEKYKKSPGQIITMSGSDSILQYIISAFSEEEDELLTSEGTFIGWYVNGNKYNRRLKTVPMIDYRYDLDGILNNINYKTKIIYLANPNNPTGTMFTKKEFENFMAIVPGNILVVLDEAYTVYAEDNKDYPNGLIYENDNLIICRTLSKAYGLAGLRIGFAIGPEYLIQALYKVKLPFEPNLLAQEAAIAALDDEEFLLMTKELNRISLEKMAMRFDEIGIRYIPTWANFFLLIFPTEEYAVEFNEECLNRGLILRHVKSFGIPNGIRINSGTDEETEFALSVIQEAFNLVSERHSINHIQ